MELVLFSLMGLVCLYGAGMMLWWWRRVGKATKVYLCTIAIFFGIAVGSCVRVQIIRGVLPEHWGALIPIIIICGVVPVCVRMTRRAWIFSHSTEDEVQSLLNILVCPILGMYCAALAQHKKGKEVQDGSKA